MKKILKRVLLIGGALLGLLIIIVVVFVAMNWDTFQIMMGNSDIDGETTEVPVISETVELPEVEPGEADWLCWRGADGDGLSKVTGIKVDWSEGLKELWSIDYLCHGKATAAWSAPVIKGKHLIVIGRTEDEDLVFCLNAQDGSLIWEQAYPARAGRSYGSGSRATPWIDRDKVYTFGRSGDLICWQLKDGTKLWHANVNTEGGEEHTWGHSTSPLVYKNLVIVNGGGTARTIAYTKDTGEVAWKSGAGISGYAAITIMPIEGDDYILSFHGKGLAALDPDDGTQLWDAEWITSYDVNATTPVYSNDLVFISSGYNSGGQLMKVSKAGTEVVWKNKAISAHHTDPFIIDGYIYGYSGDSMQNDGAFKCVELETGTEMWSTDDMGWGTCVRVEGYILAMDIKGNLFLMEPTPGEFKLITSTPMVLGEIKGAAWTVPVLANDRLYIRFKQRLVCFKIIP